MKRIIRILLLGLLTWIVPFFGAFFFFDKSGQISTDIYLFKSIMIIVGGITGAFAITIYFKKIKTKLIEHGIIIGICWFALNILLDLLVLLPMSQMAYNDYFNQIGLRYLMIPIMSIMGGNLLAKNKFSQNNS